MISAFLHINLEFRKFAVAYLLLEIGLVQLISLNLPLTVNRTLGRYFIKIRPMLGNCPNVSKNA